MIERLGDYVIGCTLKVARDSQGGEHHVCLSSDCHFFCCFLFVLGWLPATVLSNMHDYKM